MPPIPLRSDFEAQEVRAYARKTKDGPQARRLLALAAIYEGASRSEAAKIGGVTLQIVRDWVLKFNVDGPEGLIDRKAPGQPPKLNNEQRAAIAQATLLLIDLCGSLRSPICAFAECRKGTPTAPGSRTSLAAAFTRPNAGSAGGDRMSRAAPPGHSVLSAPTSC